MLLKWAALIVVLGPLTLSGNLVRAATLCVGVKDYADLPLANAGVAIVNLKTNAVSAITTAHEGVACTSRVPEGLYAVEVSLAGFLNVRYYPVRVTFPDKTNLAFRLPFGDITEGGIGQDAIVSGTLTGLGEPVKDVEICLRGETNSQRVSCTRTNELGEYALLVPPATYRVDLKGKGLAEHSTLAIPAPGVYRDRIKLAGTDGKREHP